MVQDIQHMTLSDAVKLAFLRTASKEQYDTASAKIGGSLAFGPDEAIISSEQAKRSALKESQLTKFEYNEDFYYDYLSQHLSTVAQQMYSDCLSKEKVGAGLRIWLDHKKGNYWTLNTFWIGTDGGQGIGKLEGQPVVRDAELVPEVPEQWVKGEVQQIVLKRDPKVDGYLSLRVGGQVQAFVALREPDIVPLATEAVVADNGTSVSTGGAGGKICPSTPASGCVKPKHDDGYLVVGSGSMIDFASSDGSTMPLLVPADPTKPNGPKRGNWDATVNKPEMICLQIVAKTGDCMTSGSISGRVTAIERFPKARN